MNRAIINEDLARIIDQPIDWLNLAEKHVLITGANGFLASYIVRSLLHLNDTILKQKPVIILAVVRNLKKSKAHFEEFAERKDLILIHQDITIPFDIEFPVDIIIHAASQASSTFFGADPVGTLKANTIGTSYLLDLAKKKQVENFLFFSSGEVYGVLDDEIDCADEQYPGNVNFLDVRSCYAESKRMGETMCVC